MTYYNGIPNPIAISISPLESRCRLTLEDLVVMFHLKATCPGNLLVPEMSRGKGVMTITTSSVWYICG